MHSHTSGLLYVDIERDGTTVMAKIEVQTFFYDLIHCKDKILS